MTRTRHIPALTCGGYKIDYKIVTHSFNLTNTKGYEREVARMLHQGGGYHFCEAQFVLPPVSDDPPTNKRIWNAAFRIRREYERQAVHSPTLALHDNEPFLVPCENRHHLNIPLAKWRRRNDRHAMHVLLVFGPKFKRVRVPRRLIT